MVAARQPNPDRSGLKLRSSLVVWSWQKGASNEYQTEPESGISGERDSPEYTEEVFGLREDSDRAGWLEGGNQHQ